MDDAFILLKNVLQALKRDTDFLLSTANSKRDLAIDEGAGAS